MPIEYTFPPQDLPLRLFNTPSHEYFAEVQTIGSEDKESGSDDHVRTLSAGMSCDSVLALGAI
jgi:uncharacterized pyridoxal phosphate-containing UPF0001 family protein